MDITLPQSLFTVQDLLMSLGMLVVAVYVIMNFLKEPLKMFVKWLTGNDGDWIVRPATVLVALGILVWLMRVQETVNTETIGLAIINAFLVALIAGAGHDYIVAPTKAKSDKKMIAIEQGQLDLIMNSYKSQVPDVSPPISDLVLRPVGSKTYKEPPDTIINPALAVKTNPLSNS